MAGPASATVRHISDTALWAAHFRAQESRRPDALFRDPYAEKLGAEQGSEIARNLPEGEKHAWAWVTRTYLFDQMIQKEIDEGADLIVNCAAGLDARPYRMPLPPTLEWIEADLPDILAYKTERLAGDTPKCHLQRVAVNLADREARRRFLTSLENRGKRGVVLTEGLIIYLASGEVAEFARDLSGISPLHQWILDLHSPPLLKIMQRRTGQALQKAGAPFRFAPEEGPAFFAPYGWKPVQIEGYLHAAAKLGRPPLLLRLLARLFDTRDWNGKRPWSGVCVFQKNSLSSSGKETHS
jgi:methyltransferase (TIGR00027 family)